MPAARWNAFSPGTPTWQIVLRCVMGGLAAGIAFGVLLEVTGAGGAAGGVVFGAIMAIFLCVVNLRQMERGPWAPD